MVAVPCVCVHILWRRITVWCSHTNTNTERTDLQRTTSDRTDLQHTTAVQPCAPRRPAQYARPSPTTCQNNRPEQPWREPRSRCRRFGSSSWHCLQVFPVPHSLSRSSPSARPHSQSVSTVLQRALQTPTRVKGGTRKSDHAQQVRAGQAARERGG
jgi:hypothetical protein